MTAEAVSKDKLFAHADILDKGDMGWTVIGAGAAFETVHDVILGRELEAFGLDRVAEEAWPVQTGDQKAAARQCP